MPYLRLTPLAFLAALSVQTLAAEPHPNWQIGSNGEPSTATRLEALTAESYSPSRGYGFEYKTDVETVSTPFGQGLHLKGPAVFSVEAPEGGYRVELEFYGSENASPITIKTEARRLNALNVQPEPLKLTTIDFTAHLRQIGLKDGGTVKLKSREIGGWHWDDRLQIEINSSDATLVSIRITQDNTLPVIYIIGDSTLTDQREEPWVGWGQMLPLFFQPDVVIANYAESGLSFSSFKAQRRLDKILDTIKPGDFALIQFGHNDQKEKGDGIGPWQSYTEYIHEYVGAIRAHGAHPILVTPMKRRRFDEAGRQFKSLGDYPLAVRKAAADLSVPLIDLNYMSGVFYAALGPQDSTKAFVHYPAHTFPGQDKPLKDDTHFNAYGGYELARCIVEGLKLLSPELALRLKPDYPTFDPAEPDAPESLAIPSSPVSSVEKPDGN